jgi:hypothetical protein
MQFESFALMFFCLFQDGQRKIKGPHVWPIGLFFAVIGGICLYYGISRNVPEWMYWPPSGHVTFN